MPEVIDNLFVDDESPYEAPVSRIIFPDTLFVVDPVVIVNPPLCISAVADAILKPAAPAEVAPEPDDKMTEPPVCNSLEPDVIKICPPILFPPLPACKTTLPLSCSEAVPEARLIFPEESSALFDVTIAAPLEPETLGADFNLI